MEEDHQQHEEEDEVFEKAAYQSEDKKEAEYVVADIEVDLVDNKKEVCEGKEDASAEIIEN